METLPLRPFLSSQLPEVGLTPARLRRAVESGQVRRLFTGIYVSSAVPDDLEVRLQAVRLGLGPGQIACDRTAAWIHGIDLYRYGEYADVPIPEFCVRRGRTRTRLPAIHGMTRDLADVDIETRSGLTSTTPLRTALDLGAVLYRRDALAALDQYRRLHDVTLEQLVLGAERYRGRRGVRQLRFLIPLSDPRSESIRETWTRLAILDAGLPAPETQYWWRDLYRLDLAYPRQRVAVEYDGEEFHLSSSDQVARDRARRDSLREDGWELIVVRNGDFSDARLSEWTGRLRAVLDDRRVGNRRW